jgi:hypothetical protein
MDYISIYSREGGDTVDSIEESIAIAGSTISIPYRGGKDPPEIAGSLVAKVRLVGIPGL